MPFVWCLGYVSAPHMPPSLLTWYSSILGPALGGALAQPCVSYPTIFSRGGLFDEYPFLLPNLVCVVVLACGVVTGILFLKETHAEHKHRRDYGLETGQWLLSSVKTIWTREPLVASQPFRCAQANDADLLEAKSLLIEDGPPEYRTNESSPRSSRSQSPAKKPSATPKPAATKAFTKQVVLTIVSYGILA